MVTPELIFYGSAAGGVLCLIFAMFGGLLIQRGNLSSIIGSGIIIVGFLGYFTAAAAAMTLLNAVEKGKSKLAAEIVRRDPGAIAVVASNPSYSETVIRISHPDQSLWGDVIFTNARVAGVVRAERPGTLERLPPGYDSLSAIRDREIADR